jgi:hypothetical protein
VFDWTYKGFGTIGTPRVVTGHPFAREHIVTSGSLELFELGLKDGRGVDGAQFAKE